MYIAQAFKPSEAPWVKKLGFSVKCIDGMFYATDHIDRVHLENYEPKEVLREKFKKKEPQRN